MKAIWDWDKEREILMSEQKDSAWSKGIGLCCACDLPKGKCKCNEFVPTCATGEIAADPEKAKLQAEVKRLREALESVSNLLHDLHACL